MVIVSSGQITLTDMNDAKSLALYITGTQAKDIIFDGRSTYTPLYSSTNNVLTPELYITGSGTNIISSASSVKWYVQVNGTGAITEITGTTTDYTVSGGNPKTLTLKTNLLATNERMHYICEVVYNDVPTGLDITTKAEYIITKRTNALANVFPILSNEYQSVPSDSAGNNQIITGATSTISVFEGQTDVSANYTFGNPVVVGLGALGTAYTLTNGNRTVTLTGTNPMTADLATVVWTGTRSGYPSVTKTFTIGRLKQGIAGTNGTNAIVYYLSSSHTTVNVSQTGVFTPSSLVFNSRSQTGSSAPTTYNGRFIIADSPDGSTYTDRYTSSADENTRTFTPTAGSRFVRTRLYLAGGTTSLIDETTVPFVLNGVDSHELVMIAPNGMLFKNSVGTLTLTSELYRGSSTVTPSSYKWYLEDASATTVNGGDTDGGNGWRLLQYAGTAPTTAPTLGNGTGGTLTANTYYVSYTWLTPNNGETPLAPESSRAITSGQTLTIQIPTFPAGVTGARVYVSTVTGLTNHRIQGTILTSGGTLTISAPISTTSVKAPTVFTGITGFTTKTITVTADMVTNYEVFKCIATFNSVKYEKSETLMDVGDPYATVIQGVDTFKNGQGSTTLKAVIYRGDTEQDTSGAWTYTWKLYDSANNLVAGFNKTGKTVTVNASEITGRGRVVCEVDKP